MKIKKEMFSQAEVSSRSIVFSRTILFTLASIIFLIFTIGIIIVSEVVYFPPYLAQILIIAGIAYGFTFLFIILGIKIRKLAKKSQGLFKSTTILACILLITILGATYLEVSNFYSTTNVHFYPRQHPINIEPNYKFNTTFGDLNNTHEENIYWPSGLPTNVDNYAWGESYLLRQFVHMYNLTKNMDYLYGLIERMDIVANNSDTNQDSIPGYGNHIGNYYLDFVCTDGMILHPMLELANMVKNDPNQTLYQELKPKFDNYASLSEKIIQKWNSTNWVEYRNEITGEISGSYLAPPENIQQIYNRNNAMGRLMLELYQYTNNVSYGLMTEKIARFFKENLKIHTYNLPWDSTPREMYHWGYSVVLSSASSFAKIANNNSFSDVSHASIDVSFVDMCYRMGIVFNELDMTRFANTFIDFVYRGRLNETGEIQDGVIYALNFADIVNGGISSGRYFLNVRSGWFKMAKYYRNQTTAAYVVFTSLQDWITSESYNSLLVSLTISIILENIYINHDFPYQSSFY